MRTRIPLNIQDYFENVIETLPSAATLVIVFDPRKESLGLPNKYCDLKGKEWVVFRYSGDDVRFRRVYTKKPQDPNFPHIILVSVPSEKQNFVFESAKEEGHLIDASFISDILEKADKIVDLNLTAVLGELVPDEIWPDNTKLYQEEIGCNLVAFTSALEELRREAPASRPLNKNHLKTLVLCCRHPEIPITEFLFEDLDPASILERYLRTVFSRKLKTEDCEILRELAQERATPIDKDLIPWFEEEPVELATFLYCFDILKRYRVVNPFIQLNGLGILDFDTSKLRNKIDEVLSHIATSQDLLADIFKVTERTITEGQIARLIRILPLLKLEDLATAILHEKSPLLVFGLINRFFQQAIDEKSLNSNSLQWAAELPHHSLFQEKVLETDFTQAAKQTLTFLCELLYIEGRLQKAFQRQNEITPLLDWYKSSGAYRLELAHARARSALRVIESEELREELKKYLKEVRERIYGFLEEVDLNLSDLIKKDQKGFFTHPRLSTNVLRDLVLRASREPSDKTRLWILIFDGMRLDTWEEVVKRALSSLLEVSEEKLYLCPLPSYTDIARTSLLAGRLPSEWEDYQGKYTSDHNILASRLFGLGREEGKRKLRIIVGSETDYGQERLDFDVRPHNILIYNLSDDWIHSFRGDIKDLNDDIDGRLRRTILPDLESRIAEDDFVILTSDHGFIELLKNKEVKIPVSENLKEDEIVYRYIKGGKYEVGLTVQWIGDEPYTVAIGRGWYGRPRGKFSRYSHGGVSLDEMVVPGVVLKKVTKPVIDFEMFLPEEFEFLEDSPAVIEIEVLNRGNQEGAFTLAVETDVGQGKTFERRLASKLKDRLDFHFTPELAMKSIRFVLSYKDAEGIEKQDSRRMGVRITPKKGKIEIDTSALDRLDQI